LTSFNGQPVDYDANGNITNGGTNSGSWDARNHLSAISGGPQPREIAEGASGGTTEIAAG
jgi:hypothetical protein